MALDNSENMKTEYAAGIVGFGPTALLAAIILGHRFAAENPDLKIIVFEKRSESIRQQGAYLNKAKQFVLDLASTPPKDDALAKKILETSRGEINLKDLEAFLRKKIPPNVEVIYLDDTETLDIMPEKNRHFIRIEKPSETNKRRDFYCHHILGADGANQYSAQKIEKNFRKEMINITDSNITYHASIQLKVDSNQAQPAQTQKSTQHKALHTMVFNRSGAYSRNKQKYSVTLQITEDLFKMPLPQRNTILLDMAKDAVVKDHPSISKDALVLHHSRKHPKKDKLQISCFTTQKKYCLNRAISLHEGLEHGFYLPLGNLRKAPNYKDGAGIGYGYEDAKMVDACLNAKTLSFDYQRYINELDKLDAGYLGSEMREAIIKQNFMRFSSLSPREQLERWITSGLISIKNDELIIDNNEEIQILFNDLHQQALGDFLDEHPLKSVRINYIQEKQAPFISQVIEVAAQNKNIETLYFRGKYVVPEAITALKTYGHYFKRMEITCTERETDSWLRFMNHVIDEESSQLRAFGISIEQDLSPPQKVDDFSVQMRLELTALLTLITNTKSLNHPLSEALETLIKMSDVQNHADLLESRNKLLEKIRTSPSEIYQQLASIKKQLPYDSSLMPLISSMIKKLFNRKAAIDHIVNNCERHLIPEMKFNDSTKTLTLDLSENFSEKNVVPLMGILMFAKKNNCSTLVITLPPKAKLGLMDLPLSIIQQLDTEYGRDIKNLVIMPTKPQSATDLRSYYFIDYARPAKEAILRHGKYLEHIQIACKACGDKYDCFQDLPNIFRDMNGRDVELVIHDPYQPISVRHTIQSNVREQPERQEAPLPKATQNNTIGGNDGQRSTISKEVQAQLPIQSNLRNDAKVISAEPSQDEVVALKRYYKHATTGKGRPHTNAGTVPNSLKYSGFFGDRLKTQVLLDIQKKLRNFKTIAQFTEYKNNFKQTEEYQILNRAQGSWKPYFQCVSATDSIKAVSKLFTETQTRLEPKPKSTFGWRR